MCSQPIPPPLSPPPAKLMIMALVKYGYQSRRGIRVPKKWRSSYSGDVIFLKKAMKVLVMNKGGLRELQSKYLGVPLISSRLLNKDCKILVESAKNRIGDWKNRSLSFAGRLQLCKSVISSMHVYWASVLAIPKGILYDIQALIRGFHWCNGDYKRGCMGRYLPFDYVYVSDGLMLTNWKRIFKKRSKKKAKDKQIQARSGKGKAPTWEYEETSMFVPEIEAANFEIKHG
ncbi:hypothetical protein Tco_0487157 [Tanacetum coccineum]